MSESVTVYTEVRAVDDAISTTVDGEEVILNLQTDMYHGLNHVGSDVWELIQDTQKVQAIIETLAEEYDIEADAVREDVLVFVRELAEADLIDVQDGH